MIILRQKLDKPVSGYWEGGPKSIFNWRIYGLPQTDIKGQYIKAGSWEANHWFSVALGKTETLTLSNAKRHLKAVTKEPCTFEYISEN